MKYLILIILLFSCASSTKYKKMQPGESYGFEYQTYKKDPRFSEALFIGNSLTTLTNAYIFSNLAAFEKCHNEGMLAILLRTDDFTTSSTAQVPQAYNYKVGNQTHTNFYTTSVTTTIPAYTTLFRCMKKFVLIKGGKSFKTVSKEMAHIIVKDFKGAVLVGEPADPTGPFKPNDLITEFNGKRIEGQDQILDELSSSDILTFQIKLYRNKKPIKVNAEAENKSDEIKKLTIESMLKLCASIKTVAVPEICKKIGYVSKITPAPSATTPAATPSW